MHPEKNTTKNVMTHLSHNNYRNIELRHSSRQKDSIVLTQASVNQLPGSSDVNNRRFLSLARFLIPAGSFRRSQIPGWRRRTYVVESRSISRDMLLVESECEDQVTMSGAFWNISIFSVSERPFVWTHDFEALSVFRFVLTFGHKSRKNSPIELCHHDTKIPFWGCDNHFSRKEILFNGIRDTVVKFTDCVVLPWVWDDECKRIAGYKLSTSTRIIFSVL